MATVTLSVDLVVDIPQAEVSTRVHKVCDSLGSDRTADFTAFCKARKLPLATQTDVERAVLEFARVNQSSLP